MFIRTRTYTRRGYGRRRDLPRRGKLGPVIYGQAVEAVRTPSGPRQRIVASWRGATFAEGIADVEERIADVRKTLAGWRPMLVTGRNMFNQSVDAEKLKISIRDAEAVTIPALEEKLAKFQS